MRREGRQHGMVRYYETLSSAYLSPRPQGKIFNELTGPPTTGGSFTRVSGKPTNHSKYTGKCGRPRCRGCHSHPVCKSIDKVKGAHKMRSTHGVLRVVDGARGLKFAGFSASRMLDDLGCDDFADRGDDDDGIDDYDDDEDVEVQRLSESPSVVIETDEAAGGFDVENEAIDEDDRMGFCEVGLVWEEVDGDESWCLVQEI